MGAFADSSCSFFLQRKLNAELYSAFRDELCFRYAKAMYFANELDTPKAVNMRSQCSKLKGFSQTLDSFPSMWPTRESSITKRASRRA